ncbi:Stage II sporulation protein E (SpoIIE) [Saccharicrinis carchari]|uniref:Stage II sporulation protein E (SpoIIE) n=1 Tax=Saccharicrinis carchari TaxID=1168039 RepID=A0A521DSZ0_SACCC|nr:SpoIIE family protein phosphatase [Saccharicrinis carchari]SMO74873.1 Stage II sporulation protein E (SpoIIE) [Saccharicrinis carchari]
MEVKEPDFFLDIDCQQNNHFGEYICGDVFLSRRIKEDARTIVVLSDGMGSGVKANVLATLTASMAVNFTVEHKEVQRTAEIIMNTLPVCSVRKVSYSTFTIIDIDDEGSTTIVEYDNPRCLIMRSHRPFDPGWNEITLDSKRNKGKKLHTCHFQARKEDRIFFWSDGIVQSGMGSKTLPFGWGRDEAELYVIKSVKNTPFIASAKLSRKIVNMASLNDGGSPLDDTSCGIIYLREPRRLLFVTGPPFDEKTDVDFALKVQRFGGKKIVSGGTTAEIIARELGLKFSSGLDMSDPDLPPTAQMEGIDLVTEGILTLGKVVRIMEHFDKNSTLGKGPANQIVKLFLESDKIQIINGTRINVAHQDPSLPVELEIRRTVVKRIAHLLESKFLKEVSMEYI